MADGKVCCTKNCYNIIAKVDSGGGRLTWTNDAKDETPNVTSQQVVINWLTDEDNYIKFRGKDQKFTKKHYCEIIAIKINHLTKSTRTDAQVLTKIASMEDSWRSCNDWINNTGQGVLKNPEEGQAAFDAVVAKRCPFYYDIGTNHDGPSQFES